MRSNCDRERSESEKTRERKEWSREEMLGLTRFPGKLALEEDGGRGAQGSQGECE